MHIYIHMYIYMCIYINTYIYKYIEMPSDVMTVPFEKWSRCIVLSLLLIEHIYE